MTGAHAHLKRADTRTVVRCIYSAVSLETDGIWRLKWWQLNPPLHVERFAALTLRHQDHNLKRLLPPPALHDSVHFPELQTTTTIPQLPHHLRSPTPTPPFVNHCLEAKMQQVIMGSLVEIVPTQISTRRHYTRID